MGDKNWWQWQVVLRLGFVPLLFVPLFINACAAVEA
jgi:hypothetical protein